MSGAIVVDCRGITNINATPNPLLRNLVSQRARFPIRADARGFVVDRKRDIRNTQNAFVIGPLLNEASIETHVESIRAVYQVAEQLSETLLERTRYLRQTGGPAQHFWRSCCGSTAPSANPIGPRLTAIGLFERTDVKRFHPRIVGGAVATAFLLRGHGQRALSAARHASPTLWARTIS